MNFQDFYLTEEFNNTTDKLVVVYGGRFHPPHSGHTYVYQFLSDEFAGHDVFIATSDKYDPPKSPFTFEQKIKLFDAAAVDTSKIVKTRNVYNPVEITEHYDPETTVLVLAVSSKDMDPSDPRFSYKPKKDGSPSYLQQFTSLDDCKKMNKHAYVYVIPTIDFNVGSKVIKSASEIREIFINGDDGVRESTLRNLYKHYTPQVMNIFKEALITDNE